MNAYFNGLRKQSNAVHGLLRNQLTKNPGNGQEYNNYFSSKIHHIFHKKENLS